MNKTIGLWISIISIVFGVIIIFLYGGGSQGGEGALTILGLLGMPLTIVVSMIVEWSKIDIDNKYVCYFAYFLQYQLLALFGLISDGKALFLYKKNTPK